MQASEASQLVALVLHLARTSTGEGRLDADNADLLMQPEFLLLNEREVLRPA